MIYFLLGFFSFIGIVLTYFFVILPDAQKRNLEHKKKLFNNWQEPPLPNKLDEGFNEWSRQIHKN